MQKNLQNPEKLNPLTRLTACAFTLTPPTIAKMIPCGVYNNYFYTNTHTYIIRDSSKWQFTLWSNWNRYNVKSTNVKKHIKNTVELLLLFWRRLKGTPCLSVSFPQFRVMKALSSFIFLMRLDWLWKKTTVD